MRTPTNYSRIHRVQRYRAKRYRAKQRYRADFFSFFWRDDVAPGVLDLSVLPFPRVLRYSLGTFYEYKEITKPFVGHTVQVQDDYYESLVVLIKFPGVR